MDLTDSTNLISIISKVKPREIYNLGAQSHVKVSFDLAEYTANTDGLGTLRLLDAIISSGIKDIRFYQASTSELYGGVQKEAQNEDTPFYPRSPYAVAKQFAYWIVVNYREAYNLHASNGILFNHESPRRGPTFVTRKITRAAARIKLGRDKCLYLGNLEAKRDWGHAKDYVRGMWLMLQQDKPGDFVLGTGEAHSVREFVEKSFAHLGMPLRWEGEGLDEVGIDQKSGRVVVRIDPRYFRPTEVDYLQSNPTKAREVLGWEPEITFDQLVQEMTDQDLKMAEEGNDKD